MVLTQSYQGTHVLREAGAAKARPACKKLDQIDCRDRCRAQLRTSAPTFKQIGDSLMKVILVARKAWPRT